MESNLDKLPEFCLSVLETNSPGKYVIGIIKGERSYSSTTYDTHDLEKAKSWQITSIKSLASPTRSVSAWRLAPCSAGMCRALSLTTLRQCK